MKPPGPPDNTLAPEGVSVEHRSVEHAENHYCLRLFVTGSTPGSFRAIQNIRAFCEERLRGCYDLEIIDVYQHREVAGPDQVIVTPTLLKDLPLPARRMVGDLSNIERLLAALNLTPNDLSIRPPEDKNGF
jgi:circadian clock protein KaiB